MLAPRSIAAALGLLAFSASTLAGLWAGNPVYVILSRSIWAMVLFTLIGLFIGSVASAVVREHAQQQERILLESEDTARQDNARRQEQKTLTDGSAEPMGT